MFDQLVESRPHRARSMPQTLLSVAAHTIVIAISIQLTRAAAEIATPRPVETEMRLTRAPVVRAPAAAAPSTAPAVAAAPVLSLPTAPSVVPTSIPPIDLGTRFDRNSFDAKGLHRDGPPGLIGDSLATDGQTVFTLEQADDPAHYLDGPKPVYPPALRQVGVEGSVQLRYIVGADGRVDSTSVAVTRSTNRAFEAPAIDAVRQSRFRPATIRGRNVRQLVEQVVRFTLKER